jgi:NIMA (never in mitosis gene a)-related kinase
MSEHEYYRKIGLLAEGAFGKAYLVECLSDGARCVIKQVDLSNMNDEEKRETSKEARILELLKHPNIIRFREVYRAKQSLCIVMDYADGKSTLL